MSRVQLALNVSDIDAAVDFYATLFATPPAKRRPGYANFAVENPPLKLVLFENPEATGTLNHLGVERDSIDEVHAQADRLEAAGLTLQTEADAVCCYARQSKHWVTGPDGQRWESYVVLADAQAELEGTTGASSGHAQDTGCCGTASADGDPKAADSGRPAMAGCC